MKKESIILLIALFLLLPAVSSANNTTLIAPKNFTVNTQNPISTFMSQEVSENYLKYIGAPSPIVFSELIIYILILILLITIIYDLLEIGGIIDKKIINFSISIVLTLIGIQKGIIYELTQPILNTATIANKINYLGFFITILITIGILVGFKILKVVFKKMKEDAKNIKTDEKASQLETLSKIQEIQARAAGIKK